MYMLCSIILLLSLLLLPLSATAGGSSMHESTEAKSAKPKPKPSKRNSVCPKITFVSFAKTSTSHLKRSFKNCVKQSKRRVLVSIVLVALLLMSCASQHKTTVSVNGKIYCYEND